METARVHPVIPWQFRTVMNECSVSGHQVPAKTTLLICQTAPHYADDLYTDPLKFDIDRYLPERQEHRAPGRPTPPTASGPTCALAAGGWNFRWP